jgi:hypothetical protein
VDEALGRLGCRAAVVLLDPHSLDEVMIDIQMWAERRPVRRGRRSAD